MKRHTLLQLLLVFLIAALTPMAAFALSSPLADGDGDDTATTTTTTTTQTAYFQFSGCGRTVLYAPSAGAAQAPVVENGTPTETGYKWTLTFTATTDGTTTTTTVTLKNDADLYLHYENGAFTAVSDEAQATSFTWSENTYCTDTNQYTNEKLSRHQLLLPGSTSEAVGVRNGTLQTVKANSRFAQVYLAESTVAGPDLPELSSDVFARHYYNILMYWLNEASNISRLSAASEKITGGTATNANAQWRLVETGDMGNFVLLSKDGYYMKQATAAEGYTRTTSLSEAVEFQLVDAVDQGAVQFYNDGSTTLSGATWADFWQLKNASNGYYLYEGGGGQYGGTYNNFGNKSQGGPAIATYCGGINRCTFVDQGRVGYGKYFQFTGQGRYALYEKDGIVSAVDVQTDSIPSDLGYQWEEEVSDNGYRIKNGNGRYLTVSADGFTATSTVSDATEFNINNDTYYAAEGLARYNLQPVGNTTQALGVNESGQLALVNAGSRYAAVGCFEVVKGPDRLVLDDQIYTMSTFWAQGTTYAHVKAISGATSDYVIGNQNTTRDAFTSASAQNAAYQWIPVSEDDGSGDFRLYSLQGLWLTQTAKTDNYTFTSDYTQASRLRLVDAVEMRDSVWVNFWQIKNVGSEFNTFMFYGNGNALGGTKNGVSESGCVDNDKGAYNNYNNRIAFVPAEADTSYNYIYFSALGPVPLCDNARTSGIPSARNGVTTSDDKGAHWTIKRHGCFFTLLSRNGLYLTYNATDGFGTDALEANAYRFRIAFNSYENNSATRLELLSTDGTKALCADYQGTTQSEYALTWGTPNTRFSTLRKHYMLNTPAYPEYTFDGSKLRAYRIYTNSGNLLIKDGSTADNDGQDIATAALSTHTASTFVAQDNAEDFWFFERYDSAADNGDVYLRSCSGRYFAYNTDSARCVTTTDKSAAARVRLVENDAKYQCWQIEIIDSSLRSTNVIRNNSGKFVASWANADASYFLIQPVDLEPDFYEEEGGMLRFLQFKNVSDTPYISNGTTGSTDVTTVTSTSESGIMQRTWKNIGSDDNFVLKNAEANYLTYDETTQTFSASTDSTQAQHFALFPNTYGGSYVTWCLVLLTKDSDGHWVSPTDASICIVRNDDGTLTTATYADVIGNASSGVYFSSGVTPIFSNSELSQYYYVSLSTNTDKYLTDNTNGAYDAKGDSKYSSEYDEPYNSQLWSFVGTATDFVMMSRDSVYLCWNKDPEASPRRFSTTLNLSEAAHFAMEGTDEDLAAGAFAVKLLSSDYAETGDVGQYLYYFTEGSNYQLGLQADATAKVKIEHWDYVEAEDYSAYSILPKRSYYVKRVQSETQDLPNTIIQPDADYGFDVNKYTGEKEQTTNVYTIHHYLKDGTARTMYLPSILYSKGSRTWGPTNLRMYQRFYNYETGECVSPYRLIFNNSSRRRYANGTVMGAYLGLNKQASGYYVDNGFTFQMPFETPTDYRYTLALDASAYTDFVDYYGDNSVAYDASSTTTGINLPNNSPLIEPTLSSRALYVIHNAREMADSMRLCVEGNADDRWIETHTISFPKKKVNFKNCTVPFNLQLQNYWFYNSHASYTERDREHANADLQNITSYSDLEIEIDAAHNSAGLGRYTYCIEGAGNSYDDLSRRRFLAFRYPKMGTDGKGVAGSYTDAADLGMALGDSSVIKVYAVVKAEDGTTAIRYQLAKFTLLFLDDAEPLPYSDVLGYATDNASFKSDRAPLALEKNYGTARARIKFDFDQYTTYRTPPVGTSRITAGSLVGPYTEIANSFAYPVKFGHSTYNFEPNASASGGGVNTWGSYSLIKAYKTTKSIASYYKTAYPDSVRFANVDNSALLYIDASELPGQIVSLAYDGSLCKGSRLFFSAWIGSPNNGSSDNPANVIFTVKGIYTDDNGEEQSEELYSYCPGPILCNGRSADGTTVSGDASSVVWQQCYFSFINNGTRSYTSYEMLVNNACTDSKGGDILIDDISMYALSPSVTIERTTPVCGQQVTLAKLTTDFEGMLNTLGLAENEDPETGTPQMWYCMVDKNVYDTELAKNSSPSTSNAKDAFFKALVGNPNSTTSTGRAFRSVKFSTHYNELPEFNYKTILNNDLSQGIISRETTGDGVRHMIISDKLNGANLQGNHKYYLIFVPRYATMPITAANAAEEFQIGDRCCVMSEFVTAKSVSFLDDGGDNASVDDTIKVCANQNVNITAKLNGINTNTGQIVTKMPMYDWWLDYVQCDIAHAFIDASGNFVEHADGKAQTGETSVKEALVNFRHHYPKATSPKGLTTKPTDADYPLTEAMLLGLEALMQPVTDEYDAEGNLVTAGHIAPLHLYSQSLNVSIPQAALGTTSTLTLLPIEEEESDTIVYCYDPQYIHIQISGQAPTMYVGFRDKQSAYPTSKNVAELRMGKSFMTNAATGIQGEDESNRPAHMLRLPLRSIKVINTNSLGLKKIERNGVAFAPLYLVGTNDDQTRIYNESDSIIDFRVVGEIYDIKAPKAADGTSDADQPEAYADIYLFKDFEPREGFYYEFRMGFEEEYEDGHVKTDEEKAVCDGSLAFRICIVPEYQKWTGAAGNPDWSNDKNWARADKDEIFKDASDTYPTNAENGVSHGYVPIGSTNVIIPDLSTDYDQPALYDVENNHNPNKFLVFNQTGSSVSVDDGANGGLGVGGTHTINMEYDLAVDRDASSKYTKDGTTLVYECVPIYTNTCKNILIQHKGSLQHAELLEYEKAWMEYRVDAGRWYTLGSPFRSMLAGDWYAPTATGKQQTELFKDVTFNTTDYNRFSPAVYQRGWDKGTATVYYLQNGSTTTTGSADVAIRADWSGTYNDVDAHYDTGGFSLKTNTEGKGGNAYSELLFRLPKEDASYDYYKHDDATGNYEHHTTTVMRKNSEGVDLTGRLNTDLLASSASFTQKVTNNTATNRFFLVGNPFPCAMDMKAFFDANTQLQRRYWLLTKEGQTAVMRGTNATGWISVNNSGVSGKVAPGQGFFVEATTDGAELTVTFNTAMQTDNFFTSSDDRIDLRSGRKVFRASQDTTVEVAVSSQPLLRIRAQRDGLQSEAVVVKNEEASNRFVGGEDMQTLLDNTLSSTPTVYTVADSAATTVNVRRTMQRVPLGISSNSVEPCEVTFSGLNTFSETLSLLDSHTGQLTPLTLAADAQGEATLTLPGLHSGRYFILSSEQPDPDDNDIADQRPYCTVDHTGHLTVHSLSAHPLTYVQIVDAAGRELYRLTPYTPSVTVKLPTGVYVIDARTDTQQAVCKVTVD